MAITLQVHDRHDQRYLEKLVDHLNDRFSDGYRLKVSAR